MATVDDLKVLLEHQSAEHRRERERDAEWRGRFGSLVERLANEVQAIVIRVDRLESGHVDNERRTRAVEDSSADLEGRVVRKVGDLDIRVARVETETRAQTPIINETHTTIIGLKAQLGLLKWIIPGTALAVSALWWLFQHLSH